MNTKPLHTTRGKIANLKAGSKSSGVTQNILPGWYSVYKLSDHNKAARRDMMIAPKKVWREITRER